MSTNMSDEEIEAWHEQLHEDLDKKLKKKFPERMKKLYEIQEPLEFDDRKHFS